MFPFYYLFINTISSNELVRLGKIQLYPQEIHFENYVQVMKIEGIADALLDALCARAAALDLAFLTLEVRASNAPAIALYRKHGFQTVGQRRNYYQKPDEDALLMTWFRREAETI